MTPQPKYKFGQMVETCVLPEGCIPKIFKITNISLRKNDYYYGGDGQGGWEFELREVREPREWEVYVYGDKISSDSQIFESGKIKVREVVE